MVKSLWNDEEARVLRNVIPGDLGLRVYTSRLLGRDKSWCCTAAATPRSRSARPTSSARRRTSSTSRAAAGTWRRSRRAGFAPCGWSRAARLATLPRLSDPADGQRAADGDDPRLGAHAVGGGHPARVLPFKYVDHTHADAVVTLTNTPDGEALIREIYGDAVVVIPYVMPGFDLARLCAERFPRRGRPGDGRHGAAQPRHLLLRRRRRGSPTSG